MATEEPIAPATVATEEKPKKVKKAPVKSKPRSPSLHPPYFEMIKEALVTLKERSGSSQYAITKFIEENQKNLPANFKKVLLTQLKKFVAGGKLVKVKASYKLPAAAAPAKKKPAAKPKAVKKIAPAKVAKPKPAPKPKVVAKAKVAAATKAKPKPKAAKTSAAVKKATAKKVGVKSLKPKAAIAKKATGTKKTKK
ncbi:putative linker histone H1/H5, domain H15, winged helix-like DNA-binding domain superfamily [Helianthus annuus]|uniref:Histone H5, winged helix-like DNA-binding domain superfamily n=1 Tax=Helianthus annuus TaxID=4232 RepID=A0A251V5N7_HELAN|nr:histone H1 [Helianthus annuus]KAF5796940.1 putative histone H5, winged helix-like DNA-binding domain superfamily [Helianthus annuus]KAJ0540186.1 putative linker histone H1/H5, domain H15, winged helix-like DNA-binding domain superfamily [Helianthus annuus]KAJ0548649.1 putative linker histone H1/H5, domain H15, winged helix-like DNA-binding domain superfamily [Helianthus annuus]KAJ0554930.1 putative linker histone H1/H5, domain H15, winged helix-like DNA-binding domain superfamily [Helianthus